MLIIAVLTITAFSSCSNNDEPETTPDNTTFSGTLSTTIPALPGFAPVTSNLNAKITWLNPEHTSATINLDAFNIATGMPGRDYAIGAMEITGQYEKSVEILKIKRRV